MTGKVTLRQLVELIDPNKDQSGEKIQLVGPGGDWDEYDTISACSKLLEPLYGAEVAEIWAFQKSVVRVRIDWQSATGRSLEEEK